MTARSIYKLLLAICMLMFGTLLFVYNQPDVSLTYQQFKLSIALYLTKTNWQDISENFNRTYSRCFMPKLLVDDPSIAHLMKTHSPLVCAKQKNWIYTWDGKVYFNDQSIKCDYYDIVRLSEEKYNTVLYSNFQNGTTVKGDGFRMRCKSTKTNATYNNVHFTVPELSNKTLPSSSSSRDKSLMGDLHIFFYLVDSMSRINFIRKLPQFYSFLTKDMGALVMESFNIVGDGTPWAVIPLTTGHFQYELPEARKRFKNASFLDDWPFIFNDYRKLGYGTVFAEEMARFNAYTYKLKGFNKRLPVDHYLRPVLQVADGDSKYHKAYCLGDQPKSLMWLDYWKELRHMYEKHNRRTLSILFSAETSHDDYNLVQTLDVHLTKGFKNLWTNDYLNNTLLIIMGDHGRRFGPVRQTQSGKIEEKLPFLAVIPPKWFRREFPSAYANLEKNRDRLCTVFDLHATLQHILNFSQDEPDQRTSVRLDQRGLSLFREIPEKRTCQQAAIKPHFCGCLDWQPIDNPTENIYVSRSVLMVVSEINKWLKQADGQCARLKLGRLVSANLFKPNDDLLAFKESADYDNYFPDLSANKNLSSVFFQIRMVTVPGEADWEFTVTYFMKTNELKFVQDNLSRLNMYGDQPNCIINSFHHLREYCVCVNSTAT